MQALAFVANAPGWRPAIKARPGREGRGDAGSQRRLARLPCVEDALAGFRQVGQRQRLGRWTGLVGGLGEPVIKLRAAPIARWYRILIDTIGGACRAGEPDVDMVVVTIPGTYPAEEARFAPLGGAQRLLDAGGDENARHAG